MSKNLKVSYILFFVFSSILVAFKTLSNFFGGVAINFIALIGITFAVGLISLSNKEVFKRIKDLFYTACVFCVLETVIYFACEFGYGEILTGFSVYQNIISFFGILFLCYVGFRFSTEQANKKIKFIEILLGNEKRAPKAKKAKEVSNGSLEEKPNQKPVEPEQTEPSNNEEETVIIVETEE